MPKTGQTRKTKQPLKIDRLPPIVHRAIEELRNDHGLSWQAIEDLSAEPFGQRWDDEVEEDEEGNVSTKTPSFKVHPGRGFVPWDKLPMAVLELFPDMRLPHTNLHRWWDLRVEQVQANVMRMSEQARVIAKAISKAVVPKEREAVSGAARDILLGVLAEDGTVRMRTKVAAGLIALGELQQKGRANDIRERKVAVEEQTLQAKLEAIKRKAGELLKDAAAPEGEAPALTREQVIDRVKEIYGVA